MRSAYAAPSGRALVTLALSAVSAAAQSTLATLGVVLDEHRGAVLDAAVTVTSLDTGAVGRATSDRYGRFKGAQRFLMGPGPPASASTAWRTWMGRLGLLGVAHSLL
jgi:hypothetical protein